MNYLTIWDIVLTPVYLVILILIAKRQRDKNYSVGHPLRKYYLPGLYVKFFGVIFIALIYQYYYGGGDTFFYFQYGRVINSSLNDSFETWVKLLLRTSPDADPHIYRYSSQIQFYNDPASYMVCVLVAILGLFNFTTYLPIALLFGYFSFTGFWAMYRTFAGLYPSLHKSLAIAFLFVPSTFVWGSAIFKDTVCMFGLGWMTYTTFRIFVNRDFSFKNFLLLAFSFYLIAIIKIYILLAFLPAISLWILLNYSHKITSLGLRFFSWVFYSGLVVVTFLFLANNFSKELNRYSLDKIAQTASSTAGYIFHQSEEDASAYSLGSYEPTIQGMLTKFPAGVTVTLFRPFPWEAKKAIVALSAIESMVFLVFTAFVILKIGFFKLMRKIFGDPNLTFFLIFSLIFAFAVGISSYNFGALSRYKIPCLPFYTALLIILYRGRSRTNKETVTLKRKRKSEIILQ